MIHDYQLRSSFPKTMDQQQWLLDAPAYNQATYVGRNNAFTVTNYQSAEVYSKVQQDILNYSHRQHSQNSNLNNSNDLNTSRHQRLSFPGAKQDFNNSNTAMVPQSRLQSNEKSHKGPIVQNHSVTARDAQYSGFGMPYSYNVNSQGLLATGQKNLPNYQYSSTNLPFGGSNLPFGAPHSTRYYTHSQDLHILKNPQLQHQ